MRKLRVKYRVSQKKNEQISIDEKIKLFSEYVEENKNPTLQNVMDLGIDNSFSRKLLENYNQIRSKNA